MSSNRIDPTAITLSMPRQTPKDEFGDVLSNTMSGVVKLGGAVLNAATGVPVVSAAVSSVGALGSLATQRSAMTGAVAAGSAGAARTVTSTALGAGSAEPANVQDYLGSMRAEADRSLMMQMHMQQESREYNTISNVLKVRHDSAKSAINNIR